MKQILLLFLSLLSLLSFAQINTPKAKGCFQPKYDNKHYPHINWSFYNQGSNESDYQPLWKKTIIPVILGTTALSINSSPLKQNIQSTLRLPFNGYQTHIDDYIQYAPIAIMYGADLLKYKAKHSVWNQTKFLFLSELFTGIIVLSLKHTIGIQRPDSSSFTSFPSGHTSQAFVTAQVLHNEFKNTQPVLAYSGYLFSTTTGLLRIVNNKHWLPDVLMGAGIAILTTNLIYYFEPFKNWTPKFIRKMDKNYHTNSGRDRKKKILLTPTFSNTYTGLKIKLKL